MRTDKQAAIEECDKLLEWCLGDRHAADFLARVFEVSQIADDFVDRDVPADWINGARMLRLLHLCLVDIPANPFYIRHSTWFTPLLSTCCMIWEATEDWRQSEEPDTRMFAYTYREIGEQIVFMAARLIGGLDHARAVIRDVHAFYHVHRAEAFDKWEKEQGHG